MALKLNGMSLQSQKLPSFALPPMASCFPSPKLSMASTVPSISKELKNLKKSLTREMNDPITHSMPPEKVEIFNSMENWVENNILMYLTPVENCWQPQDFLPDPASDRFHEQIKGIRERAKVIPDDYFVVLVGLMVAEEAVTSYQSMLNTTDGTRDETGASLTSWAIWIRGWTAEQNRHGDLLNKYLYLSGRIDTRQVEKTIQYLIALGMNPMTENNPYMGFIYSSFQERATCMSYRNAARLAQQYGDTELAKLCDLLAAEEKRHETAYTKIIEKLFEIDPDETVRAFADMMRKKITMPAHFMYDGRDENLFNHFSTVAERLEVYTSKDYTDNIDFLVDRWKVKELTGLSADGRKAQDFVCQLSPKLRTMGELAQARAKQAPRVSFSWIFYRELKL